MASGEQLASLAPSSLSGFMLGSFLLCCGFSLYAVPNHGAVGIIAANCLNLLLRIVFSLHFIVHRVPTPAGVPPSLTVRATLRAAIPGAPLLASLGAAFLSTHAFRAPAVGAETLVATLWAHAGHVGVGVVALGGVLGVALATDDVARAMLRRDDPRRDD